ncbi:hypothetical protein [Thermogutta terrifontis]|uniref:hypothetical protein n=1 Tax=Thermogutta terrifontis TaxID=1331910 RepID=UPI000BA88A88|nr:hypothetical protein [Thermogutta terrifontis]
MLRINGALLVDYPCVVEVDPYVPLAFEAYNDVLPGPRLFLMGDSRSLLKIRVDADSFLLRGVELVIFDRVLSPEEVGVATWEEEREGLPLVDPASVPGEVTEEHVDFGIALVGETLVIDWSGCTRFDKLIRFHTVGFYTAKDELRRVAFSGLSTSQQTILAEHISRHMPQHGPMRQHVQHRPFKG